MKQRCYKLPLKIGRFFNGDGGHLDRCPEMESIDRFLELLITTFPGEHGFDHTFGTQIWDLDFENVVSRNKWEERFVDYVAEAVRRNEKRIRDINVEISLNDVVHEDYYLDSVAMRKKVDIYIDATLNMNNERCRFVYSLYLGPLSNE